MKIYTGPDGAVITPGEPFTLPNGMKFPYNWLFFATDADLAQMGIVLTIVDDPPPPPPPPPLTVISFWGFISRFTDVEYAAVMKAINSQIAAGNGQTARWLALVQQHGVDTANATVLSVKAQLVAAGLLTQARADIIFAPPP